jgi:hypothetical protein
MYLASMAAIAEGLAARHIATLRYQSHLWRKAQGAPILPRLRMRLPARRLPKPSWLRLICHFTPEAALSGAE